MVRVNIKSECKICQTKKSFKTHSKDYRLHSTDNLFYCSKCGCLTPHIINTEKEKSDKNTIKNYLKEWSNKQLIKYISNKTSKWCWEILDNVVEELEKRLDETMINNQFKVICSKCDTQIKTDKIIFVFAPNYKWVQCPKCKGTEFRLCQN